MHSNIRFSQVELQLFLHAIDAGSITAGSRLSRMPPASGSARIQAMEEAIGVKLLERSRTGVKPTQAGEALAQHARQLQHMPSELGQNKDALTGRLRLLSDASAIIDHLPQALVAFLKANPALGVDLEECPSNTIVSQLLNKTADLGIVTHSAKLFGLESRFFRRDQLVLVVSKDNPISRFSRISFEQVLQHDFIGLGKGHALQQYLNLQATRRKLQMHTRIHLRNFQTICHLVGEGVGVAVMPAIVATRHAQDSRLAIITLDEGWATYQLLICARRFSQLSPPALQLVNTLLAPANAITG